MERAPLIPRPRSGLTTLIIIALILSGVFLYLNPSEQRVSEIPLSTFIEEAKLGDVTAVHVRDNRIDINFKDGKQAYTIKEGSQNINDILSGVPADVVSKIKLQVEDTESSGFWMNLLVSVVPFLLIVGFFLFMFRQAQNTNNQALSFGKSRARLFDKEGGKRTTFADVAGAQEAKTELIEVVDFLKNPAKYQAMGAKIPKGVLLVGAPGTGKCVTGETLVLTNKGMLPIRDIPKYFYVDEKNEVHGAKVLAYNPSDKKNKITKASHWYALGKEKTVKITTQQGVFIEGTHEHPIIVLDRSGNFVFRKLSEVKKGDMAVVKYNTQFFGTSTRIPDEDTAYLLGLLIGDGGLTVKGRISFTTNNKEMLTFVKKYFLERYKYHLLKTSGKYDWMVSSADVLKVFFENYGLTTNYSQNKQVPEWIMLAPKPIVKAFIQGVFDTDGSCDARTGYVQLSTASPVLSKQINSMLLNFGVVNRLHARRKIYNNKLQYYVEISGDFLRTFADEIGFRLEENKKEKLKYYISTKSSNTNTNLIFAQHARIGDIWLYLKKSKVEVYKIFNGFGGLSYKNIKRYINASRIPSLQALRAFMRKTAELLPDITSFLPYRHVASIVFSGFYFSPIVAIEKGEAEVFDFTVPKYHSFVGNGIISHNTLLARAVAGEANVPFFNISGSEFVEMFVGVGASRVRDLFKRAKRNAPCIVFIDEIDAVGRQRGAGLGGGHDEREQTLNQILTEMDGFETNTSVIVMAATNRPDVLDPALLRPGRFDRRVVVDQPDIKDREAILKVHSRGKPLSRDVDLSKIARQTSGFVGADLENLMNEGALLAARHNKKKVTMRELERSIEKVLLGPERKSKVMSKKEKEITAFHEVGHALVAHLSPGCDPVHKVSIISRGMALGVTWFMPEEDKHLYAKSKFEAELASLLGGYVSEELMFGHEHITTGASNDLEKATEIARKMVTMYGMSQMGPVIYGDHNREVFLGRDFGHVKNYSEEISSQIDAEIRRIIAEAYDRAKTILTKWKGKLTEVARVLLEKETLSREEFLSFFVGEKGVQQPIPVEAKKAITPPSNSH